MEELSSEQTKKILLMLVLKEINIKKIHNEILKVKGTIHHIELDSKMENIYVYFHIEGGSKKIELPSLSKYGKLSYAMMMGTYTLAIPIDTSWKSFVK
jgi:hypothetical protein